MNREPITLDGSSLRLAQVVAFAREPERGLALDPGALARLAASRTIVDAAVARGEIMYGINTGFGKLATVRIPFGDLDQLQLNLIRSHSAGVGEALPAEVVRAMMLLRANVLLRPTSGVRPALVEALAAMANAGIVPLVPEQGSVGASGDLAPLSHLALALMGEGEVLSPDGKGTAQAGDALRRCGLAPFRLAPKEGISFINGTQAQTAALATVRAGAKANEVDAAVTATHRAFNLDTSEVEAVIYGGTGR